MEDAEGHENEANADASVVAISLGQLPPLLTPRRLEKKRQALGGSLVVLFGEAIIVGVTQGVTLTIGFQKSTPAWWIVFGLIYGQVSAAVFCLVGLLAVDPRVVPRTQENCFPIPTEMNRWLEATLAKNGEQLEDDGQELATLTRPSEQYLPSPDESCNDTYCTRCLVWRRSHSGRDIRYFHCNICQRCVGYYDHHCDVFGRCIAGTPTGRGNLKFFYGLLGFGASTYLTCLGSLLAGLVHAYDAKWVVPVFVVGVVLLHQCTPCFRGILSKVRAFCLDVLFLIKNPNR
eukprot:scaffold44049_cov183-Amphora_coffeaeformis.AAC.1